MKKAITVCVCVFMSILFSLTSASAVLQDVDEIKGASANSAENETEDETQNKAETETEAKTEDADEAETGTSAEVEFSAKSVVLMEKSTGKILYAKNENERLYPASVTKIMTILLVCEALDSGKIKLTDTVSCSENAASKGGSQIWLEPGETMSVDDLLKAACVYSANDACTLLGEYISGSESAFVAQMNERAKELGMNDTHFDNCTGLDDTSETHLTTAHDVAVMSRELIKHDFIKTYTTIWMDTLRDGETQLVNTNKLVRFYKGITGLKTGTTSKAGCCISATAKRDGMELIAVVMGSETSALRFESAQNLLDYGFASYELAEVSVPQDALKEVRVVRGVEQSVGVAVPEITPVLTEKGNGAKIETHIEMSEKVEAPVEKDSVLGKIVVTLGSEKIGEYKLKATNEVGRLTFVGAAVKILSSF